MWRVGDMPHCYTQQLPCGSSGPSLLMHPTGARGAVTHQSLWDTGFRSWWTRPGSLLALHLGAYLYPIRGGVGTQSKTSAPWLLADEGSLGVLVAVITIFRRAHVNPGSLFCLSLVHSP